MATTTMSIRVGDEVKSWLERFSLGRGTGASAATRLLEEARRREMFPGVAFRDTPLGRLAYVQETRVAVAYVALLGDDCPARRISEQYGWPLWKSESVAAYIRAFPDEVSHERRLVESFEREELFARIPGAEEIQLG